MNPFFYKISNNVFLRRLVVFLLFLIVTVIVFFPFLSGDNIIRDFLHDFSIFATGYNFFKPFGEALQNNQFSLWLPQIYGGFPVWLTQVGFFSPLGIILFKFFDYVFAYNWLIFLNFLFAGLAMYWLARNLYLSVASSIIAGLTYELSHIAFYWGSLAVFSNVYMVLPLLFVMILKLKQGKKFYLPLTALIIAYSLVAGETQVVIYSLMASLAFWIFLNWREIRNYKISFPIIGFISAVVLGAILASFWIIPVINYLPYSTRTGGAPTFNDLDYQFSWGDPLAYFYPFIALQTDKFINPFSQSPFYIAVLSLFLAIFAIIFWRKNKFVSFFTWLFAITFILRIKYLGLAWLLNFVPILNRFRAMLHWYFISVFALAILAGFGLEYFNEIKSDLRFRKYVKFLKIFTILNIIAVLLINVGVIFKSKILEVVLKYYDSRVYSPLKKFSLDYYHNIITELMYRTFYTFSLSNPRFLFPFLFVGVSFAVIYIFYKNKISFSNFKILIVCIVALNLILVFFSYRVSSRSLIETMPDTARFIQNNSGVSLPLRVVSFNPSEMYQKFELYTIKDMDDYYLKTFAPNLGLYFGIETISGHDPFVPRALLQTLGQGEISGGTKSFSSEERVSGPDTLEEKINRFASRSNQELLGFLNVKYVFSSFEFPKPWKKVFETIATERTIPIFIYENPGFIERAYLVNKQDIRDRISKVSIIDYSAQYIRIRVRSVKENTLVFSEMNLPTWLAYIDGKQVEIQSYKDLFMSVKVPSGEHEVVFKYPNLWEQYKYAFKNLIFNLLISFSL